MMDFELTPVADLGQDAHNFVANSWVRARWQGERRQATTPDQKAMFFDTFPDMARGIIARGDVMVAHFQGAPELFIGWIAYDLHAPSRLHYIYVKKNYRAAGYARQMLESQLSGNITMSLRPCRQWVRAKAEAYGFRHNPYQLSLPGGSNARNDRNQADPRPQAAQG